MDPRKKEIELLNQEIERLDEQINNECAEMGRRISESDAAKTVDGELKKYLQNIASLRTTVEGYRGDIERIKALTTQGAEQGRTIEANEEKLAQLRKERETRYEEIGAAAYRKFKMDSDNLTYREMFAPVLEVDAEISKHEEELRKLEVEEADSSLLGRLLKYKTRKIIVRGTISKLEKSKQKAYFDVGQRVVNTDFMKQLRTELATVILYLEERRRAIDSLNERNSALAADRTGAVEEIKRLGAEDSVAEKTVEIEKRIEDVSRELRVMHCWAGQHYVERDLRETIKDDTLIAKYGLIGGIRKSIGAKKRRTDVLRAEIEIDELLKKEKGLRARRKSVEEEMRVHERQINVLDIELSMGQRRIEELKHVIYEDKPYSEPAPLPPSPDFFDSKEKKSDDSD